MRKKTLPLSKVYGVLEPGPVVLLTSAGKKRANIMTLSWHMMIEFEPPRIGCIISNRNYTFDIVRTTKECVINVPSNALTKHVVGCGNTSGRTVDKYKRFSLSSAPAMCVASPLIDECFVNLECTVIDLKMVTRYNLFIFEVLKAWIDPGKKRHRTIHHHGNGRFMVAGTELTLPSKKK